MNQSLFRTGNLLESRTELEGITNFADEKNGHFLFEFTRQEQ